MEYNKWSEKLKTSRLEFHKRLSTPILRDTVLRASRVYVFDVKNLYALASRLPAQFKLTPPRLTQKMFPIRFWIYAVFFWVIVGIRGMGRGILKVPIRMPGESLRIPWGTIKEPLRISSDPSRKCNSALFCNNMGHSSGRTRCVVIGSPQFMATGLITRAAASQNGRTRRTCENISHSGDNRSQRTLADAAAGACSVNNPMDGTSHISCPLGHQSLCGRGVLQPQATWGNSNYSGLWCLATELT